MESIFTFLFKHRPIVFDEGRFGFAAPGALWLLLLVAAVVVGVTVFTYLRVGGKAHARDRALLAGLRIGALAVIAFLIMRPTLVLNTVVPQQNYVGILIDDSRSMRIADGGHDPRSSFVAQAFGDPESELLERLSEKFQVRFIRFSDQAERLDDPRTLVYDGARTRIAPALDRARQELSSVPLSGLVVVTDGADNAHGALSESLLALKAAQIPVYTVGLGRAKFDKDIELSRVATPRTVLQGSSLQVDLMVAQSGYAGQSVTLLIEDAGRIVGSKDIELPPDGEPTAVRVNFKAESPGPRRFRFRVPTQEGELVLENNEQEALIMVRDDREKILYFEGEPRYEVAFMRRAVETDENLQLVVLQRTAPEKYLRLAVDSAAELIAGFPKTRDELFRYRGLILGSVEASHFTHEQLLMIEDFVAERGGGLLMLGGRSSFAEGGWAGTPVADALPVELDAGRKGDSTFFAQFAVRPTRSGATHAITQIADDEKASAHLWESLPELSGFNRVGALKPGATALLAASGGGLGEQPVLAFQRYGRGQAAVFTAQDAWIWQMHSDVSLEDQTHETFWRQLLRWMVNGVPDQIAVELPADRAAPGETVRVLANVDDESYLRVNNGRVSARVIAPSGDSLRVPMEWTVDRDGEYVGTFTPSEPGLHEITVEAAYGDKEAASSAAYVDAAESRSEFFGAQMREPLLKRIADDTGGRFYTPATIATLPEDLAVTGKGVTVVEERELWDMPINLILLVLLVGGEWLFRRRKGLA